MYLSCALYLTLDPAFWFSHAGHPACSCLVFICSLGTGIGLRYCRLNAPGLSTSNSDGNSTVAITMPIIHSGLPRWVSSTVHTYASRPIDFDEAALRGRTFSTNGRGCVRACGDRQSVTLPALSAGTLGSHELLVSRPALRHDPISTCSPSHSFAVPSLITHRPQLTGIRSRSQTFTSPSHPSQLTSALCADDPSTTANTALIRRSAIPQIVNADPQEIVLGFDCEKSWCRGRVFLDHDCTHRPPIGSLTVPGSDTHDGLARMAAGAWTRIV
jgi:hypothetical protein